MQFLKKNISNILFGLFLLLLIIPQTRLPIQVFLQRLLSSSPPTIREEKRALLVDYDWQLSGLNHETLNLDVSKGKVVLVNFWATWCPPCLAEMPSLQALYNDYGSRIDFYCVSNEPASTLKGFLAKKGYTLPVYIESSPAPDLLSATSLPTTFVISKKGQIVIRDVGAANWNSQRLRKQLDALLGE
ncbi:MAG: redoxin domain-containing protein [Terrimonas sp.]|nr:redoxin domain-containing protein [Terrimonas sp.]